jgi:hypothetical protein
MIYVFFVLATPLTYCNICLMELLCVNDLNAKIVIYLNYIFLMNFLIEVGEYIIS